MNADDYVSSGCSSRPIWWRWIDFSDWWWWYGTHSIEINVGFPLDTFQMKNCCFPPTIWAWIFHTLAVSPVRGSGARTLNFLRRCDENKLKFYGKIVLWFMFRFSSSGCFPTSVRLWTCAVGLGEVVWISWMSNDRKGNSKMKKFFGTRARKQVVSLLRSYGTFFQGLDASCLMFFWGSGFFFVCHVYSDMNCFQFIIPTGLVPKSESRRVWFWITRIYGCWNP